jgi:WD40 repeat protein/CubicO group peptidase (beta-lactamase class C family)
MSSQHSDVGATGPYVLGELREYRLLAPLGSGGMGMVYRAVHTRLDKEVALKVLPAERMRDPEAVARFEREIKAVGKLDHPNIVRATDAGEVGGTHFLVMELIDGIDLAHLVEKHGPPAVVDACELIRQAALGLEHAHAHGLIHRDVKPSNLLLSRAGQVKLLDLGLALLPETRSVPVGLTASGVVMGTIDYMAPEQADNPRALDARADLYSLGCTLYHLLTGRPPFAGPAYQSPAQKLKAHALAPVPPIREGRPEVPADLAALLERLLAKDPGARPAHAVDVAVALEPFAACCDLPALTAAALPAGGEPAAPATRDAAGQVTVTPRPSRRRPLPALAAGAVLAIAGVLAAGVYLRLRTATGPHEAGEPAGRTMPVAQRRGPPAGPPGEIHRFVGHDLRVNGVAATPDGKTAVSGGYDGVVRVWDLDSGRELRQLGLPGEAVRTVAVSPDGRRVLSAGGGRSVDGEWQVGTDTALHLRDLESGREMQRFRGHTHWVKSVGFSADGTRIVSGANDRSVRLWDPKTGAELRRLEGHMAPVDTVAVSPDGRWVASGSSDRTVRLWSLTGPPGRQSVRILSGHAGSVTRVAFSPDGRLLLSASTDRTVRLWDVDTGREVRRLEHPTGVLSAAFSPDGRRLLSSAGVLASSVDIYRAAGRDEVLRLWDAESGRELRRFPGHTGFIPSVTFLPDGYHALSASLDGTVRLWRLEGTEPPGPEVPVPLGSVVAGVDLPAWEAWWHGLDALGLFHRFFQMEDAGGSRRVTALAVRAQASNWRTRGDATREQFAREIYPGLSRQGFRLISLVGNPGRDGLGNPTTLYASVWLTDGKPTGPYAICAEAPSFLVKLKEMREQGYRPAQVNGHPVGLSCGFTIVSEPDDGTPYRVRHDLSADEYPRFLDDGRADGYRPTSASGYTDGGRLRFTAVLLYDDRKLEWAARHGLTADQVTEETERRGAQGFRPVVAASYRHDGLARYLAVWVKGDPEEPLPLPQTGKAVPALAKFDEVMQDFMRDRNIGAGTLAVVKDGRLMLARGYGYSDRRRKRRVAPDDPFRLAGLTKLLTAAAVQKLIRAGKLRPDTRVFPLLTVQPLPGKTTDPRWNRITVQHLLDHQGGWDRDATFDPLFLSAEIAADLGKPSPPSAADVVRYMAGQPLQFAPGSRTVYSNFGYCVLGRVIEKVSGQGYLEYVRKEVLAPAGVKSVTLGRTLPRDRDPREPEYVDVEHSRNVFPGGPDEVALPDGAFSLEATDAAAGLIGSAVDVARLLRVYRFTGEPTTDAPRYGWRTADQSGTYALAVHRTDGVIFVVLFNQRTDPSGLDYSVIRGLLDRVVDGIEQWPAGDDL